MPNSKIVNDALQGALECKNILEHNEFVKIEPYKKTRSTQANRALHLYFEFIARDLNEQGAEFCYSGIITGNEMTTPYTKEIIKEYLWKPLQKHFFATETTTKLTPDQINTITETIGKYLAENFEIVIDFPSIESLINNN